MQESSEPLRQKVLAIHGALTRSAIPHAFGGAIAFGFAGVPRATLDIDVDIFLPAERGPEVLDLLSPLGVGLDPHYPLERLLRDGQIRLRWDETPVDLFFVIHDFYESVEARVRITDPERAALPILSAEDIVTFKILLDRGKDWTDVASVLAVQGRRFDIAYVRRWLLDMLGPDDSRIARLDALAVETWERTDQIE